MLIEDLGFLMELEVLWATVALAMFALFETARDIGNVDRAARDFHLDCPRAGPGRPSDNFAGPGPIYI